MDTKKQINPLVAWSLIFIFSIVVLRIAMLAQSESSYSKKEISSASKTETVVMLDFGNGKIRKFKGPVPEQMNAWGALQQAASIGSIKMEIENHFLPVSIGGYENQKNGKRWGLYLNGVKQNLDPFQVKIGSGDEIVFRYE